MRFKQFIKLHMAFNISLLAACFLGFLLLSSCKDNDSSLSSLDNEKLKHSDTGVTSATFQEKSKTKKNDKKREELFNEVDSLNSASKDPNNPDQPGIKVFEGREQAPNPANTQKIDEELTKLREKYNPTYRITRGDTIEIAIPFEPDSRQVVNIRPDGTLGYLYGVEVMAEGLTYPELKDKIEAQLAEYYIKPKVDINGKTFSGSQVYIMGPIKSPGGHIIQNNTKLLDFLSMAGVLSQLPSANLLSYRNSQTNDVVDLTNSYMMRDGKILPIDFERLLLKREMKYNIYVRANDFLFFPSSYLSDISKTVYVIGAVSTPRTYQYTTSTTFMSAIAAAGGVDKYRADRNHITIIRKSSDKIINVNYIKVINGEEPDIMLEDRDIIYIPERGLYAASRWTTTVINEIIAPLQAIIQASSTSKAINMQDWNPTSDFGPTDGWMKE